MTPITERILSIDVFRGLTIVLMILVNSQVTTSVYPLLMHADWDGFTLADLVFPSFLFIVGLTIVVSLNKQIQTNKASVLYAEILKRSIILFLLGLFLNVFPINFDFSTLRFYGVLQRIAVCYLICSVIYLNTTGKLQALLCLSLLLGYWFVMTQVPVPGFNLPPLSPDGSWVAYWDQALFSSAHLYNKTYDPEGFFSTMPSIATTLIGVLTGQLLFDNTFSKHRKLYLMLFAGLIAMGAGWLWRDNFPINKNLWTSSFVLWSGGLSLMVFSVCFLLIDLLGYRKWAWPFKVFGMNALFAFIFHVVLIKTQMRIRISLNDGTVSNLKTMITDTLFSQFSPQNASLFYGLVFLLFNFLVVLYLYQRKIFIRI
jgi:predicted acyltransferase